FKRGDEPGHWNGWVLDPDDGHSYGANVWSPAPGILQLRGYVGLPIFGRTERWTRYDGSIGAGCRLPD
ncbi:MAG: DUF2147 domain-containing protein, partial [Gluconacetobacter diazotrophicus]|nr:DUF2147 domain-containing protein [Gluconacetobacter diazotrophicus]